MRMIWISLAVIGLHSCSSLPTHHSTQPPQQAMSSAYDRLFTTANYRFQGSARVSDINIVRPDQTARAANAQQADKERMITEALSQAVDQAASEQRLLTDAEQDQAIQHAMQQLEKLQSERPDAPSMNSIIAMLQGYLKGYRIDYQGVVDLRQRKIELQPKLVYQAHNTDMSIRFPLLFDLEQQQLYADLGALAFLVTNPAHNGKYTQFDLSQTAAKFNKTLDSQKIYQLARQSVQAKYQLAQPSDFQELSLNAVEQQAGAVRKITFRLPLSHYLARQMLFFSLNKDYLGRVLRDSNAVPQSASPAELLTATQIQQQMQATPELYQNMLNLVQSVVQPQSVWQETMLLDQQNRLISSDYQITLNAKVSDTQVLLGLSNRLVLSDYGNARISYQPNANNTVSWQQTNQGSIVGQAFSEYQKRAAAKTAEAAPAQD